MANKDYDTIRQLLGMTSMESEAQLLIRKTNAITVRLYKQHLSQDERMVADALGLSYGTVMRAKELAATDGTRLSDALDAVNKSAAEVASASTSAEITTSGKKDPA